MLDIKNVTLSYNHQPILTNFTLSLEKGEVCVIIGKSGCGKSTLIKALAGIKLYDSGTISLNDEPLSTKNHVIGFVPQHSGLIPWKNIKNNILLPSRVRYGKKQINYAYYKQLLSELGLSPILSEFPASISGGQKQRVAIARAFLLAPDLLLMDESFSALDAFTKEEAQNLFLSLWNKHHITTVIVSHDINEAIFLGHKIVIMDSNGLLKEVVTNPLFGKSITNHLSEYMALNLHLKSLLNEETCVG